MIDCTCDCAAKGNAEIADLRAALTVSVGHIEYLRQLVESNVAPTFFTKDTNKFIEQVHAVLAPKEKK